MSAAESKWRSLPGNARLCTVVDVWFCPSSPPNFNLQNRIMCRLNRPLLAGEAVFFWPVTAVYRELVPGSTKMGQELKHPRFRIKRGVSSGAGLTGGCYFIQFSDSGLPTWQRFIIEFRPLGTKPRYYMTPVLSLGAVPRRVGNSAAACALRYP